MSIYDQGYQHWKGTHRGHATRWLVIAEHGLRGALKSKAVRRLTFLTLFPAALLIAALSIWGLVEQEASWGAAFAPLLGMFGIPNAAMLDPKSHRLMVWTFAFDIFLQAQIYFCVLTLLIVAPRLISQDLRANALPLYLSRPLNRWDYFLGKFAVVATCIGGVTILPLTVAYISGLAFGFDLGVLRDTLGLYGKAVLYCLVLIASAGALVLALSSLSKNSVQVSMMWILLWLLTHGIATATQGIVTSYARGDQEIRDRFRWTSLISYPANLERVRRELLGTEAARESLQNLRMDEFRKAMPGIQFGPPGGPNGPGPRGRRDRHVPSFADPEKEEPTPIRWSVEVLAGLFLVSIAILSTRVRGMDRLR